MYFFHHQEKYFAQIPVYLEQSEEDNSFLDSSKKCTNIVKKYEYYNDDIDYLPIIVIKY